MTDSLVILDSMPSAADFYELYWNHQPFVVRKAIPKATMDELISADELAGLSMEEGPQSRMVKTPGGHQDWSCDFGPFTENAFTEAGSADWSLLVQNVEQFHPDTAGLLPYFNFAPRWMLDDVMVSFSAVGGSVGPHLDSYHVFLVQGLGKRSWTVSHQPILNAAYVEGVELKILKNGIQGQTIEVTCGDVLYVPPNFGHEGTTLEPALTFSVGFLGPKISELFSSYAHYLSELEENDSRYVGEGLTPESAGFTISIEATRQLRDTLANQLSAMTFNQWLVGHFTETTHEAFGTFSTRDDSLATDTFIQELEAGAGLIKPLYIKLVIITSPSGNSLLGYDGESFVLDSHQTLLIKKLLEEQILNIKNIPELIDHIASVELLLTLYNHQALEFAAPE